MAQQQRHQRRAYVWINPAARKEPAIQNLSRSALGYWIDLPFIVQVDSRGYHRLPQTAEDIRAPHHAVAPLMTELIDAGLVEYVGMGTYVMTALSQQYYSFDEPGYTKEDGEGA